MELPKFNETFQPILTILRDGKTYKRRELMRLVEERFYADLPQTVLNQTITSGERTIENRIGWGITHLKQGGYLKQPQRGLVQITEKGQSATDEISVKLIRQSYLQDDYVSNSELPLLASLEASPQDLIDSGFEQIERAVKSELLSKLKEVDPYAFEKIILILLKKMGYGDFIETAKSGDGGIDGIINEDQLGLEKIYIQAKRYAENKVRETDIRNFIGAMSGDTRKGIFVTTSTFDEKAKTKARDAHHTIILIDGSRLVDLMHKYNVGVQTKSVYEIKAIDNDFFEAENI
jgi:restriction system protein